MNDETWRPVKGWEGLYEVSDLGRVRSLDRTLVKRNGAILHMKGRILKGYLNGRGYLILTLNDKTAAVPRTAVLPVHRAVAEAFLGPRPDGMHTAHGNGVPTDNRLENLRYCLPHENILDKYRHGTIPLGERHARAVLTEEHVRAIRRLHGAGMFALQISGILGVSKSAVDGVMRGVTWRHVA